MEYLLEHGPNEQNLAKQHLQAGLPLPEFIANAPELIQGLQLYWQAFFDLDTERSHAMGTVLIPWSSIKSYCIAYDLDDEQTNDMFYLIRQMDLAHIKKINAKKPK